MLGYQIMNQIAEHWNELELQRQREREVDRRKKILLGIFLFFLFIVAPILLSCFSHGGDGDYRYDDQEYDHVLRLGY